MLINFLSKKRKGGYIRDNSFNILSFFSNNTLCLRRKMLDDTGKYDEKIPCSEDVDICTRIAKSRWNMYHSPGMILHHRMRNSMKALLRQWWNYGYYSVKVYLKYNRNILEIYTFNSPSKCDVFEEPQYYKLQFFKKSFPISIFLILGDFFMLNISLLAALFFFVFRFKKLSSVASAVSLYFFARYLNPEIRTAKRYGLWAYSKTEMVRYLVNVSFFAGSMASSITDKALYVPQHIWASSDRLMKRLSKR